MEAYRDVLRNGTQHVVAARESEEQESGLRTHIVEAEVHHRLNSQVVNRNSVANVSYREAVSSNTGRYRAWSEKIPQEEKTQCQCAQELDRKLEQIMEGLMNSMVTKVGKLLIEIFNSSIFKESKSNKK